jgi:hypothetical protein
LGSELKHLDVMEVISREGKSETRQILKEVVGEGVSLHLEIVIGGETNLICMMY